MCVVCWWRSVVAAHWGGPVHWMGRVGIIDRKESFAPIHAKRIIIIVVVIGSSVIVGALVVTYNIQRFAKVLVLDRHTSHTCMWCEEVAKIYNYTRWKNIISRFWFRWPHTRTSTAVRSSLLRLLSGTERGNTNKMWVKKERNNHQESHFIFISLAVVRNWFPVHQSSVSSHTLHNTGWLAGSILTTASLYVTRTA